MVRLAFAAINAVGEQGHGQQAGKTREAQEAHVAESYLHALQLVQEQQPAEAQARPAE